VRREVCLLPPATRSGGRRQCVNLARGIVHGYPLLLCVKPTDSLDAPRLWN
jgi:alpha-D-ribose 1-methylphosphonate 5-triphosphate synthase subunit PhnL